VWTLSRTSIGRRGITVACVHTHAHPRHPQHACCCGRMNSAPRASSRPSWSTTLAIAGAVVMTAVVAWWQRKKQRQAAASPTPPTQPAAAASAHPHEAKPSEGKEPQDSSGSGDAAVVAAQLPPSGRALPASQLALVAKVCRFWFGDADPQQQQFQLRNALWFRGGAEVDAHIATEFKAAMNMAAKGKLAAWATAPRAVDVSGSAGGPTLSHTHSPLVALVLLLDQFPRNAFRGTAKSFDADAKAVEVVQVCGWSEVGGGLHGSPNALCFHCLRVVTGCAC